MIYVSPFFHWVPQSPGLHSTSLRWHHQWCRLWSDRSFAEMSRFFHEIRGKSWCWRQDGRSLPYYLITPEMRRRALRHGAGMRDWDNPQLPLGVAPLYDQKKIHVETHRQTLAYQSETETGTVALLATEADVLAATTLLRGRGPAPDRGVLHPPGDAGPPPPAAGEVPL